MDRQPVLVVTKGPLEGARFPVPTDGLSIGRSDRNVILDDANVSRYHARLVFHNAAIRPGCGQSQRRLPQREASCASQAVIPAMSL